MGTNKSKWTEFLKQLASADILGSAKSFLSNFYTQLETLKVDHFKKEHREEFLTLRSQCRELINETRGFCDKAIPSVEYALAQFSSPNPVDVKMLAEKVLSRVNPENVLNQCQKLEYAISNFNDRLMTDPDYKQDKIKQFFCIGFSVAMVVASLIAFFYAPVVMEVSLAVPISDFLIGGITGPSIIQLSKGLMNTRVNNDLKQCKEKTTEAMTFIHELKMELSKSTQNHGRLEIPLDAQDVHDLKPIYEDLLQNMKDIRDLCSKPLPSL